MIVEAIVSIRFEVPDDVSEDQLEEMTVIIHQATLHKNNVIKSLAVMKVGSFNCINVQEYYD
jgi:hypothetical protein